MDCVRRVVRASLVVSFAAVLFFPAIGHAQVFQPINSFLGCDPLGCAEASDGGRPDSQLVVGPEGNFYGTTYEFPGGLGTIYRVTPSGTRTTLMNFSASTHPTILGPDGCFPVGRLAVGADAFYGVTDGCGLNNGGVLFRLAFAGPFSVLHHFPTGASPSGGLAFAPDGDLIGITANGGDFNQGTVFRWDGNGVATIHSFGGSDTGSFPKGDLTLASDGNVYGATTGGGGVGEATLFRITPEENVEHFYTMTTIGVSGGGLLQASDGHLYGTTVTGSNTIFRITLAGGFTPLHTGVPSLGNLIEGFGGVIYGTTDEVFGPPTRPDWGRIFQITPAGALTTVHAFDGSAGRRPRAGLVLGGDGHLYGTTYAGGTQDLGTFYRIALPPAVDVTANGLQGPVSLAPGAPLQIRIAFDAPGPAVVNPAHLLIGFASPFGVYWLGPSGIGTAPVVLYSGPLPGFAPALLFNFPSSAALPSGDYYWFMIVLDGSARVFADSVKTVVP